MTEAGLVVQRALVLVEASPAAAMQLLAPYLASEPDDPMALCVASQALLKLTRAAQALELSRRAASLNPQDDWPLRLQALALHQLERHWDAQLLARQSVSVNPGNWQTHYMVACADLWASQVTVHSAAAADKARELAPNEPRTHELCGQIALASGRSRDAVACFEQALRLDPDNAVAQHELARAQFRRFRIAKSLQGFLAVGRMDPSIQQTQHNLQNIAVRATMFLHYAVFLAFLLSRPAPVVSSVLLAAFAISVLLWARYRGGPALLRFARSLWRRDRLLVVWAGLAATAGVLVIVRPLLSVGHDQTGDPTPHAGLLNATVLLLLAGVVISWLRRGRRPQR